MSRNRQSHLGAFMRPVGIHTARWRYPGGYPDANFNFAHLAHLARRLEAAKFDAFFMADHLAVMNMPMAALRRSATVSSFDPMTLLPALAVQRVHDAHGAGSPEVERKVTLADVEVNQGVSVVTDLILTATTSLFEALGASAVKVGAGLDRYWRNARTIASHNLRIYRDRSVGAFAISGEAPPRQHRVGSA